MTTRRAEQRQARHEERVAAASVEGTPLRSAFGLVTEIRRPLDRVLFMRLPPQFAAAWCRTPGALHRPGLIARLAAGLVVIDARGRCT